MKRQIYYLLNVLETIKYCFGDNETHRVGLNILLLFYTTSYNISLVLVILNTAKIFLSAQVNMYSKKYYPLKLLPDSYSSCFQLLTLFLWLNVYIIFT